MGVHGDFSGLERLRGHLRKLQKRAVLDRAKKLAAAAVLTEVKLGFRDSRDPYGSAWAPLKGRSGKPLLDTGALRNSFHSEPTDRGFSIGSSVHYATYHQTGTIRMPARQMLPVNALAPGWSRAIEKSVTKAWSDVWRS